MNLTLTNQNFDIKTKIVIWKTKNPKFGHKIQSIQHSKETKDLMKLNENLSTVIFTLVVRVWVSRDTTLSRDTIR